MLNYQMIYDENFSRFFKGNNEKLKQKTNELIFKYKFMICNL